MDKKLKLKTELFKKLKRETTGTGTGASVTPGIGAGVAAKYAFGKHDNKGTPKDWKSAPSIPNRKSKTMDYKELWEGELKLGVKYDYNGESGFISTGGSQDPKDWKFLGDKQKYPYLAVKADLVPSQKQPGKYDGAFDLGMGKGHHIDEAGVKIDDIRSFNYNISKVREAIRQMRDENSEELYKDLESLRFGTDLMSVINTLDKLKLKIDKNPKLDKITMADALKAIEDIRMEYKPEEQDDDEGKFDWYANKNLEEAGANQAKINMLIKKRAEIESDMELEAEPEGGPIADKYGDMLNRIDKAIAKLKGHGEWGPETDPYMDSAEIRRRAAMIKEELQEGYAQFRNETKTRSKPDQFHQAVKQVKKKMNEINRIFEYVDRLKGELSEGEDLKYKKYTENAFSQIKESAKQLFLKSTKLK